MTDNRTTELMKLLDERGIEWSHGDAAYELEWSTPDGRHCSAMYWKPTFTVLISGCTPEQAVAATLGNSRAERTCHIEWRDDSHDTDAGYERDGAYFCTACGADLPYPLQECWDDYQAGNYEKPFNYCPNCGARRVGE